MLSTLIYSFLYFLPISPILTIAAPQTEISTIATTAPTTTIPPVTETTSATTTSSATTATDSTTQASGGSFSNVKVTNYSPGTGSCGSTSTESDMVVALSSNQFANKASCGKTITITSGNIVKQATVVDLCPGCPDGGLDVPKQLYTDLGGTDAAGSFLASWKFDN